MRASDIHPVMSPAYSPNLYAFIAKSEREHKPITVYRVAQENQSYPVGELFIGYQDDNGCFNGSRLNNVLIKGSKTDRWAFTKLNGVIEPVPDFWDRYRELGRCYLDPEHRIHFVDERWEVQATTRTCRWCGRKEHKHFVPVTTIRTEWKTEPQEQQP